MGFSVYIYIIATFTLSLGLVMYLFCFFGDEINTFFQQGWITLIESDICNVTKHLHFI